MIEQIIITTQKEMDEVPLDTKKQIIIKDTQERIIVSNKYYCRVEAWVNSSVEAWENSSVEAWGNSSVEAWGNSSVVARENSSVVARENSSVVAWENSSVEAWGNSSVVAWGNVQIVDNSQGHDIKIKGNARIVYMPKTINEFIEFYDIKHTKTKATFYKAVNKVNGEYLSNFNEDFIYEIGKIKEEKCDEDTSEDCSYGIHISSLQWALDFGKDWDTLAILEVETAIKDIVLPKNSDGKVRTSTVKVIREVPLNECGLYGKIIEKRRNANL